MLRSSFFALVSLLGIVGVANAWFRVPCTDSLVQERLDPIISPGGNPSQHVHTIHGASNFNPTYSYDNLRASNCTNCLVAEACHQPRILPTNIHGYPQDLSNYWFPKLYFQDPKTKLFEPVRNGGLLVYYQNRGDGDTSNGGAGLKAFPPGLRMITGDPKRRSKKFPIGLGTQEELRERAIQWSCLRYSVGLPGYDDNGTGFPTTDCESGLNVSKEINLLIFEITNHSFRPVCTVHLIPRPSKTSAHMPVVPACWDGENLDSADHVSHTAFLSGLDNGACPAGFLFFEVTWNVADFSGRWNSSVDKWPFVYSTGDPTGFSWHGDFQNGIQSFSWDTTALQNAIDQCDNPNDQTGQGITEACRFLTVKPAALSNECKINPVVNEVINGKLTKLPGCNPLQFGPQDATIFNDANCHSS
ncbi:WSC domain protein [Mycena venus]|uniref:WSC domain protein n=1 Tax=Mycena venus TaxID=2733690 RepID=A0A8H7CDR5_9AGAR|nr:WSC domain protein [Mycena venus]